jgi:GWxTD domain-containing protein
MMKSLSVIAFLIFIAPLSFAQKSLSLEFDYARFNYDSTSVFLEFYYDLNSRDMQLSKSEKGPFVEAIVHIEMKNSDNGQFLIKRDWKIQGTISSEDSTQKSLVGSLGFKVPAGKYNLIVNAWDSKNPDLKKNITENLLIQPFKTKKFAVSDIELSSNIKADNTDPQSIFYKNTIEVIPNPGMVYSHKLPVLFYYCELYNLVLSDPKTEFILQKNLYNSLGNSVYKNTKKIRQRKDAVVEYGLINLVKLPSDSYNLVFSLIDPVTNQAFISSKRLYLYNPGVKDSVKVNVTNAMVLSSEFNSFSSEDCDNMFKQAKYIASDKEIDMYKSLDSVSAKRLFLYSFWKNKELENPGGKVNFKEDYFNRVEFANEHFSFGKKEGYLTDRGRVLLVYGEPDQKDYYPSESNQKPYEDWFYNQIEGGVHFYFGDLTGYGNYMLLHSTKRGEVYDDNWKSRLSSVR